MKTLLQLLFLFVCGQILGQTRYDVSSISEFKDAHSLASAGDSIVWEGGTYANSVMQIDKDGLIVTAKPYGTVLFTGWSRAEIDGSDVIFSGFQFIGGDIGTSNVIGIWGSDVLITEVNIQHYTSYKYLIIDEESRRTTVSFCNFENRLNLDDQNILSILVDGEPGYHKVQYCSFKNFKGSGNDLGIEPIRIGVSTQAHLDSRSLVEYCYFTECDGDGEIISHKARQNVYRYNTFENNSKAEFVLRHGDQGIVYGNFFRNNMGGIRVREASGHYIYNNYFEGIDRRAIYLQNESSDPLSDIHIYHNTIVDSNEVILGSSGGNPPTNVVLANNIFADPLGNLFTDPTGNETWIGNLSLGSLGMDRPSGLVESDPLLSENSEGYVQPDSNSPAIAAASSGYPAIPLFEGMDYDNELLLDLMQESRSVSITDRAIGASEFSSTVNVQPHATEDNTGPEYLFDDPVEYLISTIEQMSFENAADTESVDILSNLSWTVVSNDDWISSDLSSSSGVGKVQISVEANEESEERTGSVTISSGAISLTIQVTQEMADIPVPLAVSGNNLLMYPNPTKGEILLDDLLIESDHVLVEIFGMDGKMIHSKTSDYENGELVINVDQLSRGTYVIKIRSLTQNGSRDSGWVRKFTKE